MSKRFMVVALAGTSMLVPAASAWAQVTQAAEAPAQAAQAGEGSATGEIIVNARRRDESLQDVPQTVNAISGNTLEKLNLQRFEDIQAVVPGLTLSSGNNGFTTAATIRGAAFQVESGATPTVEFYLNDALIQSVFLFQSMFDVGQIEVLRGPQGTLRGRASPSGSITVTSHRPDLYHVGGYLDLTAMTHRSVNANAAINLPIIDGVFAVRVAGIADTNEYDQVHSINNGRDPFAHTQGIRASARLEPADSISANVMYQHLERKLRSFNEVESFSLSNPAAPVVNPIIDASHRLGITDASRVSTQKQDIVTGQINWRFAGQQLSYVGSYSRGDIRGISPQDLANIFPNFDFSQNLRTLSSQYTNELRLSSDERLFDFLDYTVGVFRSNFKSSSDILQRTAITLFGRLVTIAETPLTTSTKQIETSAYGNLIAHIGDKTELSGGVRHIIFKDSSDLAINGSTLFERSNKHTPTVYNFSVSHKFTDNFLVYANTGSSWRFGPFIIGVFRPLTPRLQQFIDLKPETSKSYEVGFKSSFLDHRVRFNVAAFHQDFDNFIYRGAPVNYVDLTTTGPRASKFNFGANVPAKIDGIDVDAAFRVTPRFSVNTTFAYAKGKIKNGVVACNDLNGDGVPDTNPGNPTVAQIQTSAGGEAVAACRVKDRLSFAPDWSLTVQSEYSMPISDDTDGYVRGLLSYYPHNPNDPQNPYDNVKAYGLLNLYLGVRSPGGGWEVSVFGKNVTNTGVTLARDAFVQSTSVQALQPPTFRTTVGQSINSSYVATRYTAPREFGINLRYMFGSR